MSDVFGSMVKQWTLGQTVTEADWLIGAAILAPGFKGRALRDMANPGTAYDDPNLGKDPQPGHMKDYVQTESDNGGVHTNSGIPSRAFVLAATAIGGKSWEKTGKILVCHLDPAPHRKRRFCEMRGRNGLGRARSFPGRFIYRREGRESVGRCRRAGGSSNAGGFGASRGRLVISPRLGEVTAARPKAAKKKTALRPSPAKTARDTHKKKAKSARSRGR
jgi:hypothetical protein